MARYIDLDKVIDKLETEWGYDGIREELYNLPTAYVQEVRHGKWIETSPGYCQCSQCKKGHCCSWLKPEYCERCGSLMDGKE